MSQTFRIVIPLIPEGKRRHRSRVVKPKDKRVQPWVQEYPDPAQAEHLQHLTWYLRAGFQKKPIEGQVLLGITAFMPLPANKPKTFKGRTADWFALARAGKVRPTRKPDLSNIIKLVEDAGNGILWHDDSQIVGYLQMAKFYSDTPKYVVTFQELEIQAAQTGDSNEPIQVSFLNGASAHS